jgi:CubicO group peptidase (beta-lactamase class C family)
VPVAEPEMPMPRGSLPSGQLIATAQDMTNYLRAHLNNGRLGEATLLSPARMAELHRPAAVVRELGVDLGSYGMGWFVEETDRGTRLWHNGTLPDFFAYMVILPEQRLGAVLLVNANHLVLNFDLTEIGAALATELAGGESEALSPQRTVWILRAFLLIPVAQAAILGYALRLFGRQRRAVMQRMGRTRRIMQHWVAPGLLHLLPTAGAAGLIASGLLGVMLLFMPDLTWVLLVGSGLALIWLGVRSGAALMSRHDLGRTPQQAGVGPGLSDCEKEH